LGRTNVRQKKGPGALPAYPSGEPILSSTG
jgi:hypothetical protein